MKIWKWAVLAAVMAPMSGSAVVDAVARPKWNTVAQVDYFETEERFVTYPERITVGDFTPYVEFLADYKAVSFDFSGLFWWNNFSKLGDVLHQLSLVKDCFRNGFAARDFEVFSKSFDFSERCTFNPDLNIIGWGLSKIVYVYPNLKNVGAFKHLINYVPVEGPHVGSQLPIGSVSRNKNLIVGGVCGPECESRRNHQTKQRSNSYGNLQIIHAEGFFGYVHRLFSDFHRLSLLAKIGLVVATGIPALWFPPIGFIFIIVAKSHRNFERTWRLWFGLGLLSVGLPCLGFWFALPLTVHWR